VHLTDVSSSVRLPHFKSLVVLNVQVSPPLQHLLLAEEHVTSSFLEEVTLKQKETLSSYPQSCPKQVISMLAQHKRDGNTSNQI